LPYEFLALLGTAIPKKKKRKSKIPSIVEKDLVVDFDAILYNGEAGVGKNPGFGGCIGFVFMFAFALFVFSVFLRVIIFCFCRFFAFVHVRAEKLLRRRQTVNLTCNGPMERDSNVPRTNS